MNEHWGSLAVFYGMHSDVELQVRTEESAYAGCLRASVAESRFPGATAQNKDALGHFRQHPKC